MRRTLASLLVPAVLALSGCPDDGGDDTCSPENQKASTLDLMQSWYLYPELLRIVDPADPAYPTVNDYLWALTEDARNAGMDRGWTYATTSAATQQYYDEGTSVGFGLGLLQRDGTREFVSQVFPGSAAADAGFARGDEILAVGPTEAGLVSVADLIAGPGFGSALGPSEAGVTRVFRVLPSGAAEPVVYTVTKRTYGLDPVPAWTTFTAGDRKVGYVALRTFITPADALLTEVFSQFQQQGVQDVIVDLRYNGGGRISTAQVLSNLLGGGLGGNVMFRWEFNPLQSGQNRDELFAPPAQAVAPFRIAFITTGGSASASELVPNVMEGWKDANVGLVGAKTYGKPVGQLGFEFRECGTVVFAIGFRLRNSDGDGNYFDGLPDAAGNFSGALCPAPDDLTAATSDPAEASTAAALAWLATGSCPAAPAAAKPSARSALKAGSVPDTYPEASAPDVAQRHVAGLF